MPEADFATSAQKLARNPLGIIALFLVLVYAIAGLVFGAAAKNLTEAERQPLIWFLVLFPSLVLFMFGWLVAWHHTKLYAPEDYRDAEGFFRALTAREQRTRLEGEVEELQASSTETESSAVPEPRTESSLAPSHVDPPDVKGSTRAVTTYAAERRAKLRAAVVLAEDLAFRELEDEFGHPALRHVSLPGGVHVDGVFRTSRTVVVEVKYVRPTMAPAQIAEAAIARAEQLPSVRRRRWQFLLAIVLDEFAAASKERFLSEVTSRLLASKLHVDVRVMEYAELKSKFGVTAA